MIEHTDAMHTLYKFRNKSYILPLSDGTKVGMVRNYNHAMYVSKEDFSAMSTSTFAWPDVSDIDPLAIVVVKCMFEEHKKFLGLSTKEGPFWWAIRVAVRGQEGAMDTMHVVHIPHWKVGQFIHVFDSHPKMSASSLVTMFQPYKDNSKPINVVASNLEACEDRTVNLMNRLLRDKTLMETWKQEPVLIRCKKHNATWESFEAELIPLLVSSISCTDAPLFSRLRKLALISRAWSHEVASCRSDWKKTHPVGTLVESLNYNAMCDAILPSVYTDDDLFDPDYEWEDEDYHNDLTRAELLIEKCSSSEFKVLLDNGLVGNVRGFENYTGHHTHLIEYVMPDIDKMKVCLNHAFIDTHHSTLCSDYVERYKLYHYGNDMLLSYLYKGGGDCEAIDLLRKLSDHNFVCEYHLDEAWSKHVHYYYPDFFDELVAHYEGKYDHKYEKWREKGEEEEEGEEEGEEEDEEQYQPALCRAMRAECRSVRDW